MTPNAELLRNIKRQMNASETYSEGFSEYTISFKAFNFGSIVNCEVINPHDGHVNYTFETNCGNYVTDDYDEMFTKVAEDFAYRYLQG